jgi:hypothetical protein
MTDESYSLKRAMDIMQKDLSVILPFIFGMIITFVIEILAGASRIVVIEYYLRGTQPIYGLELFIVNLIYALIVNFFIVLAIFWQTFSSSDLVDAGTFSARDSLSDALSSKGQIFVIALLISFISLIFDYIPFIGGYISTIFLIVAFVSAILVNLNKRGFIENITGMITTLNDYYRKEPTTSLFLGLLMLVYIVPNYYLEYLVLFVLMIYGSIVLKLLN